MAGEWTTVKLSDIADVQTGPFGSQLHMEDYVEHGTPIVTVEHLGNRNFSSQNLPRVKDSDKKRLNKYVLKEGDVVFSRVGSVDRCSYVGTKEHGWMFSGRCLRIRATANSVDPLYLYYYFTSEPIKELIRSIAVGATMPSINTTILSDVPVQLPPLSVQKRIAHILGTLDDKIELNLRMNKTLEEMARALFKSWFIDFNPVVAKSEGRQPEGMNAATAKLFPDSFEDSELGRIPKGWRVMPVGEVVDCVGGSTPSTTDPRFWENGIHHWTTPKDFSSLQSPFLLETARKITEAGVTSISSGLLPAGTLLLSSRAPVGYLAIATMPVAINQGFIALKCNENASNYFMLNWCQENMDKIEGRATGTTFAEISKSNFRPIPVVLPGQSTMRCFSVGVKPLYAQIVTNLCQNRTLANLRDWLLPRLLKGEFI